MVIVFTISNFSRFVLATGECLSYFVLFETFRRRTSRMSEQRGDPVEQQLSVEVLRQSDVHPSLKEVSELPCTFGILHP